MNKQIELMKVKIESFKKTDNFVLEYCIVHLLNELEMCVALDKDIKPETIQSGIIRHISKSIDKILDEIEFYPNVSFRPLYTSALKELKSLKLMIEEQLI
jgi:hypothetical protein